MRVLWLICFLLSFIIFPAQADSNGVAAQRNAFLQAKLALQKGDRLPYLTWGSVLRDYPLYPYLVYIDLIQRMDRLPESEIYNFLQKYSDTPLAGKLRNTWLLSLAQQKRWSLFLKYYQDTDDTELQCQRLSALLATNQQNLAFSAMPDLWSSASIRPSACETAFMQWYKVGGLTTDLVWQRLQLAFDKNNAALIKSLMTLLPANQQEQVKLWQKVQHNPLLVTQSQLFLPLTDTSKIILLDGMLRLADTDPHQLVKVWPSLQKAYPLSEKDQQAVIAAIGLALARQHDVAAASWLDSVKSPYVTQRVREWRVRNALIQSNWPQVSHWVNELLPEERAANNWRYWQARAFAATGNTQAARDIYQNLASHVDYYGMLASSQLKQNYRPSNSFNPDVAKRSSQVATLPVIQRARELYILHLIPDARREWQWALQDMDKEQLRLAAQLASQWGWYDRAIITAAKVGDKNNITVRFPFAYTPTVTHAAHQNNLNPAWVFAIMRQESSFMPDAKSCVGALGLMQLMPNTARLLANTTHLSDATILDSNKNIYLGSRYLKQLLSEYKGNMWMATAAYNVGPARLQKYIPLYQTLPTDVWVETLPWPETRDYVKAVMLGMAIYQLPRVK